MLKFTNKRDVDRHVSQMTKNLSENERSSRGYAISKTYFKVSEYEIARDWLQRFLDIKTEDAAGHKFMGEIYERLSKPEQAITSYQRSYNLNTKQNDLIKSICRLFLVNDGWTSSPGKAKYWCELADTENIRDDNVLSLRLKMLNKDKKGGGKPVEEMILKEIAARPHDVGLRVRLVNFLLEEKRVGEAFKYCFDLEMKFMEIFLLSIDWYTTVSSVLAQHTTTDNWNYWCLLLISLDKKIYLNLKKDLSLQAIKQTNIKDVTNLLFDFDQVLKKAADSLMVLAPVKEIADEFINHFRGQMALHVASLLFQKQKVSNNDQWRETTKKCLPFLLFAFQCSTVNTDAFWLKNTNEVIRNLFGYLKKEGAFRCAQAGRTILACKSKASDDITLNSRNQKSWVTVDDIFNQVRESCVDLNWRKNIYRQLFANADQQTKVSTSYFVQSTFFQEPKYEIISFSDLDNHEDVAQYLYPSSLEHHVYLGLGRKDLHTYKSHTFNKLNLSASNILNCNPETINRIDVDSFLYCSVIQAKRRLEAEKDCYETFSSKPNEKPLTLPAANMVEGLCTEEQCDWWLSAFKIYKNITGENLAQLKATLQFGLEAVRGIDSPKVDVIILLKLGEILLARAGPGEKIEEKRHFEIRAEYVYKMALRMLKSRESDNMRRIFKFATSNFDMEREVDQLAGNAIGHLSGIYFKREEYKEFIEDFAGLPNPWAHYFCAEAYKKLDESGKTPRKSRKLYVEKARESLIETLSLLDGNGDVEKSHPLRTRVEKELKKMQYNLSTSFSEELDFHDASNGHVDDEIFHNASSTSFRGRRDLSMSAITQNYNEKFNEVESLIRKLSDLVVSVKDDVLCVRNDISDLKGELLNVRGDIADMNVNKDTMSTKALTDVYKAIEDLTWNVTYVMNMAQNPTAAVPPRFPPSAVQAQINQMYNTAYPMYPMQYPTSPMVQHQRPPPQPANAQLGYVPLGHNLMTGQVNDILAMQTQPKSSLLEALSTPTLLNTWNNTYNQQQQMTPPSQAPLHTVPAPVQAPVPAPVQAPAPAPVIPSTIINKPVEKAPPVNVVITSSDPLPAQNSFVSQPTLSVTIPPQHIKHAPQQTFPKQPQYENISPVKNDTSEYLEEPADYDPRPDFKPIIPLPDEIEVKTGEENEDVMFSERCKLFRLADAEWKERGIGNIKILKSKDTGRYRILMRREQIHKLCANHAITPELELKPTVKETQLMWGANDFSEVEMKTERFLVRFKHAEQAKKFKAAFEDAKKNTKVTPVKEKPKEAEKAKDAAKSKEVSSSKETAPKPKPAAPIFGSPAVTTSAAPANTPKATFSFGGLTGNLTTPTNLFGTPSTPVDKPKEDKNKPPTQTTPFANFSFGQGSTNKSYSELFGNISKVESTPVSGSAPAQSTPVDLNKSRNEDDVENYEPTAQFEPVIPLPDLVDAKTGEEDEDVKFVHRAKLLRFDATTKEWKERGIGEMKVLVHKTDSSKARLLMRREQILKLCCNMVITKELQFKKMNSNTYSFGGQDFSEAEMRTETLAIKFKTSELIEKFLEAVRDLQKNLGVAKAPEKKEEKKAEAKGFGDQFKPKVGSWNCEGCYISNKPDVLYCVACDSPKDSTAPKKEAKSILAPAADAPKFSFGMPSAEEKKTETKGFGDQFKPKVGSWNCEGCYISNKPDVLYCVACDSPKDSSVPKKESKSVLAPATDAPKFSFGMPSAGGFSFGMAAATGATTAPVSAPVTVTTSPAPVTITTAPASATPAPTGGFSFGNKPATTELPTSSFSFGNVAAEKPKEVAAADSTSGFSFGAAKTFSFGSEIKKDKTPEPPKIGSTESAGFNFVFKAKTKSPAKSRNDSVHSEGGEEEENEYVAEEENQTYFTPVIPLPDKIEVKTGEENEEVLYSHRAKLYRFVDKEWKERGLGDIKILKHRETGKLRVVMRREQIHKICLNFFLIDEIELKKKEDNSWTFFAPDFSEGEIEPTSFAIKFKNKDIAGEFKKAFDDAIAGICNGTGEKQDGEGDEKSELVKKLSLPEKFFDYLNSPDCSGCIGCKSDEYVYNAQKPSEVKVDQKPIPIDAPQLKSKPKPRRQSTDKQVSFKLPEHVEKSEDDKVKSLFGASGATNVFGSGIKKSEATPNIFAAFNAENPPVFGQSNVFEQKKEGSSIFSTSHNTTSSVPTSDVKAAEPFGGGLFGNKTNFSFGGGDNVFGGANKENGQSPAKPFAAFGPAPTFGSLAGNTAKSDVAPAATTTPSQSIFGTGFKSSFSFAEAAKDLDTSNSSPAVPDFIKNSNESGGFAALAATASPSQTWATNTSNSGGFYGLTVKDDFFSKSLAKVNNPDADTSNNDDTVEDNYDPHYEPIISLPEEIKVSTGEEDEEKIFNERAKLYRYDTNTKEWKERGVGELKILHHPGNGTYRLLLRREQIFKLVLNQLITSEFHMSQMNNSPKAFCWFGMNYAEGEGETEQLAVRFKNEDLAKAFEKKVEECMAKVETRENRENLNPEND